MADNSKSTFWAKIGKIRPQILLAICVLGTISVVALYLDNETGNMLAVTTGCTGGIIALGMKLLEGE